MFMTLLAGAMMTQDVPKSYFKAKYGVDISPYTLKQQQELFRPMNRSGTIEPLVLVTRTNALDWEIYLESKKNER